MVLRRFITPRGNIRELRSNWGINFVVAERAFYRIMELISEEIFRSQIEYELSRLFSCYSTRARKIFALSDGELLKQKLQTKNY